VKQWFNDTFKDKQLLYFSKKAIESIFQFRKLFNFFGQKAWFFFNL